MADLGKAYVQIMPSAEGISKQISNILGKDIQQVSQQQGRLSGKQIMTSMGNTMSSAGASLTKAITLPVVGATTAIGGMIGALGFNRLTGLDSAKAKLEGLGYESKSVERITQQVNDAIQGTTTTMAEGVNIAAGALAAGVSEGAELESYIQRVGNAAVGAGRDTGEMAMIFNRVQGMGRLMTQELNMIEDGMPGFSQAMAEHFGVSMEEFRKMVTAGEVSSQDFMTVMDDFAGDMSEAYAKSWKGILSRTVSNLGILGETMLSGVFEPMKGALSGFLEFIRTDEVRAWAESVGQSIGNAFKSILNVVTSLVSWWSRLSSVSKKLIIGFAGLMVAIGPILSVFGKLILGVISIEEWFGKAKKTIGLLSKGFGIFKAKIAAISLPMLGIVAVIAALVAGFICLWNTNEGFRDAMISIWNNIKDTIINAWQSVMSFLQPAVQVVVDFVRATFDSLGQWWANNQEMFLNAARNVWSVISTVIQIAMGIIMTIMQTIWPLILMVVQLAWSGIQNVIQGAISIITGIIQFFSALFTGNWSALWESVKQIVLGAVQLIWGLVQLWIVGKIIALVVSFGGMLKSAFSGAWAFVKGVFSSSLSAIWGVVKTIFSSISTFISSIIGAVKSVISSGLGFVKAKFMSIFNSLRSIVTGAFNGVRSAVSSGMSRALSAVTNFFGRFRNAGRSLIENLASGIRNAVGAVTNAISGVMQKVRNFLPGSEPKDKSSPIYGQTKNKGWGENIAKGILSGQKMVDEAVHDLLDKPADIANNANLGLTTGSFNSQVDYELNSSNSKLESLLDRLANQKNVIVLDSGVLVGETHPQFDQALGNNTRLNERWGR